MARNIQRRSAKRANKPNPREDRNHGKIIRPQFNHDQSEAFSSKPRKKVEILPRNLNQEDYVEALFDENKSIIFAMGPAGCGKTLLGTQYGIHGIQTGEFEKVIITRPAVSVDESHGFLPGSLIEKMAPWVTPIIDVFKEHYSVQQVERMLQNEQIEIAPLAYMRGRTFKNALIIFDEAQNATVNQMKMVLTRIGEGSRMIVTGDLKQTDRGYEENGLKDFVERVEARGSKRIAVCKFDNADVERHPVIEEILTLYGDA